MPGDREVLGALEKVETPLSPPSLSNKLQMFSTTCCGLSYFSYYLWTHPFFTTMQNEGREGAGWPKTFPLQEALLWPPGSSSHHGPFCPLQGGGRGQAASGSPLEPAI